MIVLALMGSLEPLPGHPDEATESRQSAGTHVVLSGVGCHGVAGQALCSSGHPPGPGALSGPCSLSPACPPQAASLCPHSPPLGRPLASAHSSRFQVTVPLCAG